MGFHYEPVRVGKGMVDKITPMHYRLLPEGARLIGVSDGRTVVKGRNHISQETDENGYIAFGLLGDLSHTEPYRGAYRME